MSTADALASHGIRRPQVTIDAAVAAGLSLPAACVMLMHETAGGQMVWGHDRVTVAAGTYAKGGPVTEGNTRAYLSAVAAGNAGRQGCGDAQLTSRGYQDRAMALGGLWVPQANQRAGFEGLAAAIRSAGVQLGFQHYNGGMSGSAASVAYGKSSAAAYEQWRQWLGAVVDGVTAWATLQLGSHGPAVTRLQTALNADYPAYSHLVVDGDFGDATGDVVEEYQRRAGLVPDRKVGMVTARGLHLL